MSERGALYVSLSANVLLGLALLNMRESAEIYRTRAEENALNRILVDKVESYGNLIVSKLPSIGDR